MHFLVGGCGGSSLPLGLLSSLGDYSLGAVCGLLIEVAYLVVRPGL